ncbi:terpenoid cylases/protein prenyltransferase alpha-alpha toroid [Stachybotrys elegans]|uniref:Protein farnesyltransferase subunit beta n=1 Tax=Stachybotrys elegans TaxID=80388 RepID=A0A8K0SRU6_9HYPO|nr:terpenoid cylases/protein prenyltransferase alpha-alpha toroid [Stachybotrys elegans]
MRARRLPNRAHAKVIFRHHRSNRNSGRPPATSSSMAAASTERPLQQEPPSLDDLSPSLHGFFVNCSPIQDALETPTSRLQHKTVDECMPFLTGEEHAQHNRYGVPHLDRAKHVRFLHRQLGKLPAGFTSADPSRPWFFYWCLAGLTLLGEDVSGYRGRLMATVRPMQNPEGGFAGGFGQMSHLATTYATVLSLALVGGEEAYDVVDRRTMWKWLCSLKQPDGGFQMAVGGEEDVRGAYCAAVIISLLNLPLELSPDSPACAAGHSGLFSGLGEWVGRCQTYEGGVSAFPGVEAHGAYAFCALGCLSIIDSPHRSIQRYMNVPQLISWLSSRQYGPEGGFSGRTNKLVDGCYSHWVGGCWPLIEACLKGPGGPAPGPAGVENAQRAAADEDCLFSRNGLIRYILCCCQDMSRRGGLRDKPSKFSDAYHTCYVLSGLSSVQHQWSLTAARPHEAVLTGDAWEVSPYLKGEQIFDEEDRVCTTHPVYVIPQHRVQEIQEYFASKQSF